VSWYRWEGEDLILRLRVQPKSSRDAFSGPYDSDYYKVTLTAAPVDGKANSHLLKFVAKAFGLPPSRVVLESGSHSRNKRLRLKSPNRLPIPVDND
jgi:uncharacterized protein (TIGR00251 family)